MPSDTDSSTVSSRRGPKKTMPSSTTANATTTRRNTADSHTEEAASQDKQRRLLSSESGHFSLVRTLHMADYVTELNAFCGVMSIFSSLRYCLQDDPSQIANLYRALAFMPFALFFDFLDGKIARWRRKSSLMGQELDSLADLISFGVAPAVVGFALGLRTTLDHVLLALFVMCGLTRLARFNVTATLIPKDPNEKAKFFEGTPIPMTLLLDGVMAYWVYKGWILDNIPLGVVRWGCLSVHPVVSLYVLKGCLMVSKTIRIPKL